MFLYDMLLALALAMLVITLLIPSKRYRGVNGTPVWPVLLPLLFLLIWASGAWFTPIGAPIAGVYWLSFLIPAIFLALLLFALSHPSAPEQRSRDDVTPTNAAEETAAGTALVFSIFLWALLIGAFIAIVASYF